MELSTFLKTDIFRGNGARLFTEGTAPGCHELPDVCDVVEVCNAIILDYWPVLFEAAWRLKNGPEWFMKGNTAGAEVQSNLDSMSSVEWMANQLVWVFKYKGQNLCLEGGEKGIVQVLVVLARHSVSEEGVFFIGQTRALKGGFKAKQGEHERPVM